MGKECKICLMVRYIYEDDERNGLGILTQSSGIVESGRWEDGKCVLSLSVPRSLLARVVLVSEEAQELVSSVERCRKKSHVIANACVFRGNHVMRVEHFHLKFTG
eukprot:TRINITY_DN2218_c0_g1_i1.p2 TRINITY_DN2218_c0_g1~~TRINITY_DN2218_c0_g1_i1.p2  ORF type:complete len:105 (-),score=28.64 TRINITY_DN2218_c0_g1_i1:337-651(-)